jgi:hypothetical protein
MTFSEGALKMEKKFINMYQVINESTDTYGMYFDGGRELSPSGKLLLYADSFDNLYYPEEREKIAAALAPSFLELTSVLIVFTHNWYNFNPISDKQARAKYIYKQYKNLAVIYNPQNNNSFGELLELMIEETHLGYDYSICTFNSSFPWEQKLFSYDFESGKLAWYKFLNFFKEERVEPKGVLDNTETFIYVVVGDYHQIIGRNVAYGDWPESMQDMIKKSENRASDI